MSLFKYPRPKTSDLISKPNKTLKYVLFVSRGREGGEIKFVVHNGILNSDLLLKIKLGQHSAALQR